MFEILVLFYFYVLQLPLNIIMNGYYFIKSLFFGKFFDVLKEMKAVKTSIKNIKDVHVLFKMFKYKWDGIGGLLDWRPIPYIFFFRKKSDDCVAEYEKIYTKNGLIEIKNINIGDEILSYNFIEQKYEYKKVINIWNKGKLQINRVHFRNGSFSDFTEDHKLFNKIKKDYIINTIKEIINSENKKVCVIKKIPYESKDIEWLNEDLCFVLGHYLAEGWKTKEGNTIRIYTSGYDIYEYIIPLLEKNNIPFSEKKNKNKCPYVEFLKKEANEKFINLLINIKENSFIMNIDSDIYNLPINKLKKIIDGILLGDGWTYDKENSKKITTSNRILQYSTSSENLKNFIKYYYYLIGEPVYEYLQLKHGGLGNKPIYRIDLNTNSSFSRNYGYNDISEVSISFNEKLGYTNFYDIEVQDNHNFIVASSGIICHNCDGSSEYAQFLYKELYKTDKSLLKKVCKKYAIICVPDDLNDLIACLKNEWIAIKAMIYNLFNKDKKEVKHSKLVWNHSIVYNEERVTIYTSGEILEKTTLEKYIKDYYGPNGKYTTCKTILVKY